LNFAPGEIKSMTTDPIPTGKATPAAGGEACGRPSMAFTVLFAFVLTFVLARVSVLLIMTHRMPNLYLHMGRTHVHHLNYGIILLSLAGAILIFLQPQGKALTYTSRLYAVGLALTFDEFGMWVHLGGPYWQRASFDAVVVIMALLGLFWAVPTIKKIPRLHWKGMLALALSLVAFGILLVDSWRFASQKLSPIFQQIEAGGPE
jgi:hypothetical protein